MRKIINKIDKPLLIVSIVCIIFGLLMVGSASSLKSYMKYGENYFYLKRQLLFVGAGLFAAYIVIKVPFKKYKKFIMFAVIGVTLALLYVLMNGKINNGIKGWMNIGSFGIQPSEFAKTVLILFLAFAFEKLMKIKNIGNVRKIFPFIVPIIFIGLVFAQPDFGTMMVLAGITAVIFFIVPYDSKTKLIYITFTLLMLVTLSSIMLISGKGLTEKQKQRFNYKNPCSRYRQETGYQVCNGFIAINSGGLVGNGYGNSKQKYLYLPEAHTDFIFAIIIEETGLVGGTLMLLAYFIIIWRIIMIGRKSYNLQGAIICFGVATYISLHIVINLGGVLGVIPLTGVPLPFYTYGGSFMINLLICIGLVQRVCIENKIFEQKHLVK